MKNGRLWIDLNSLPEDNFLSPVKRKKFLIDLNTIPDEDSLSLMKEKKPQIDLDTFSKNNILEAEKVIDSSKQEIIEAPENQVDISTANTKPISVEKVTQAKRKPEIPLERNNHKAQKTYPLIAKPKSIKSISSHEWEYVISSHEWKYVNNTLSITSEKHFTRPEYMMFSIRKDSYHNAYLYVYYLRAAFSDLNIPTSDVYFTPAKDFVIVKQTSLEKLFKEAGLEISSKGEKISETFMKSPQPQDKQYSSQNPNIRLSNSQKHPASIMPSKGEKTSLPKATKHSNLAAPTFLPSTERQNLTDTEKPLQNIIPITVEETPAHTLQTTVKKLQAFLGNNFLRDPRIDAELSLYVKFIFITCLQPTSEALLSTCDPKEIKRLADNYRCSLSIILGPIEEKYPFIYRSNLISLAEKLTENSEKRTSMQL